MIVDTVRAIELHHRRWRRGWPWLRGETPIPKLVWTVESGVPDWPLINLSPEHCERCGESADDMAGHWNAIHRPLGWNARKEAEADAKRQRCHIWPTPPKRRPRRGSPTIRVEIPPRAAPRIGWDANRLPVIEFQCENPFCRQWSNVRLHLLEDWGVTCPLCRLVTSFQSGELEHMRRLHEQVQNLLLLADPSAWRMA